MKQRISLGFETLFVWLLLNVTKIARSTNVSASSDVVVGILKKCLGTAVLILVLSTVLLRSPLLLLVNPIPPRKMTLVPMTLSMRTEKTT